MLDWKRVIELPQCPVTLEELVEILYSVLSSDEIGELVEELQLRFHGADRGIEV
jgi:hypothetical protein